MEVDEPHKEEPIASASIDASDGFERSKNASSTEAAVVAAAAAAATEITTKESVDAGGFMREHDVKAEEQKQAKDAKLETTSEDEKPAVESNTSLPSSPSKNTSTKSRNSLNLVLSPATNDKTVESASSDQQGRRTRSSSDDRGSLQLPRTDPPPTPPTRLASSSVKRRSSRSPNASATSSSPSSAASAALQNAVTSSPTPAASTSKLESSPPNDNAPATVAASSSSMKRSPSSPGGSSSQNTSTDVFGSNLTPNKRRRSSSPSSSSSPAAEGSSSPNPISDATSDAAATTSTIANNTPPSPISSPLPDVGSPSTSTAKNGDPSSSPASVSSSSSAAPEEESTLRQRTPIPRRVKVYALHESNWVDLGTGSCTWHRSVVRRRRKADQASTSSSPETQQKVPPSPPPVKKELTILGRASREAAGQPEPEEEMVEELVDLDDDCYLEEDEDEAAWIEVVKEGRWKNDSKPAKAKQKAESNGSENAGEAAKQDNGSSSEAKSDDEDEFDRLWTTRIEKPEMTAGGFEIDSFFVQTGLEEGEEVIGRYRRQQDTLIVWKSSVSDTELALSFAATAGCLEIWEFLKEIHTRWEMQMAFRERHADKDMEESQVTQFLPPSSQQETPKNGLGLDLGRFGQLGLLQDPTFGNLVELEKTIKVIARTALGREKLSTFIGRTGFIQKLIPIFSEAEDLESLTDLHTLCVLVHDILNLNDHGLWELILNDDIFYEVIHILEYDPAFPNMKASYGAHLSDPSLYVEVVPIPDETIKTKIHQIYRLQYMKDVILPRVLDDNAFQIVNSIVYFHQVDIVQYLSKKEDFWQEIFEGIFPEHKPNGVGEKKEQAEASASADGQSGDHEAKQQDAIAFLQSFAQMVKQLQLNMRTQYFRALSERGMLRVLEYALSNARLHEIQPIRIAVVEILMLLVDNDPSSIRSFVLKEHEKPGKQKTLMTAIISAFHKEEDLGVKAQLAEALRVLLLPPGEVAATETAATRTRLDDPNADNFLQYFYENGVATLLEPLTKGLIAPPAGAILELPLAKIALYTHLCDLLCFFVINHSFRSKFFILSSSVTMKVATLLRARPKHIRLAALRYFRACIGRNDDFYNRYLVKNNTLPAILELAKQETSHDNLLASACLELFEYLRLNTSSRIMLNELMSKHEDEVKALSTGLPVFQGLIAKWEQLNEPPPAAEPTSSEADTIADITKETLEASIPHSHLDDRALTAEEEDYFNADDDEDSQVTTGSPVAAAVPLKRSESTADAVQEDENPLRRKRQKMDAVNGASTDEMPLTTVADTADDVDLREVESHHDEELAKIREKRKRAEDEEDDEDFLTAKKLSQEKNKENAKVGIAAATKTKNVSGKLKLFFGKKP